MLVSLHRAVEEYAKYHRADTEAMDSKFTDIIGAIAAKRTVKQRATHATSRQSNAELIAIHHNEVAQVVDGNERTWRVLTEASQNALGRSRRRSRT